MIIGRHRESFQTRTSRIAGLRKSLFLGLKDQRIRSLRKTGFSRRELDRVQADDSLDDFCAIVSFMLADGTYDERCVVAWMHAPHATLDGHKPIQVISHDFDAVLSAVEDTLR